MKKNAIITIAVAVSLALAAGAAMAVAPSEDTETTDTPTTSQISSTYTQTYATDGSNSTLAYSADSNDTAVTIWQGSTGSGTKLATYEQNQSDLLEYQTVATGTYYINATFADDASDYPGLEADAGETVTLTAEIINRADSPDTNTNISYSFTSGANTSFVSYNDSETQTADAGRLASLTTSLPEFLGGGGNATGAAKVDQDIGVNGQDQDEILINIENADAQDSAVEVFNNSEDAGGVSYIGVAQVDGNIVPMMAEGESSPSWVDSSTDTYVTVSESGESATVHNAGDVMSEGDTTASVDLTLNEKMDNSQATSMWSSYDRDTGILTNAFGVRDFNGNPDFEDVEA